jgi:hypothetical protein
LNLHDDQVKVREDPSKLYQFSDDSRFLVVRSDDRKGVKIVSVEDCQVAKAIDNIHLRPIMDM